MQNFEIRPATEGQAAICIFVTWYSDIPVIRDKICAVNVAALGRDHAGLSSLF